MNCLLLFKIFYLTGEVAKKKNCEEVLATEKGDVSCITRVINNHLIYPDVS